MIDDAIRFRVFIKESIQKAKELLSAAHVGYDVQDVLKALVIIAEAADSQVDGAAGQSSDMSLLKKRHDQLKLEKRNIEKRIENIKGNVIPPMIQELKKINAECSDLMNNHPDTTSSEYKSAEAIKKAAQKVTGAFVTCLT